ACRPQLGEADLRGFEWHLLWRIAGEAPQAWRRHIGDCYCARFSPDGTVLATSGKDGVRVWSWPAGDQLAYLTGHNGDVNGVAFSPDGTLLATASDDRTVKIFDTQTWEERRTNPQPNGEVIGVVFSPDGRLVLSAERHDAESNVKAELIHITQTADGSHYKTIVASGRGEVQGIATSPDGRFVGLAGGTGFARFWDVQAAGKYDDATVSVFHGCCVRS